MENRHASRSDEEELVLRILKFVVFGSLAIGMIKLLFFL